MAFLKILLTAVLIFYIFSMIIKLIFNHKIRKLDKKMKQEFGGQEQMSPNEQQTRHVDPNIGEYTDFEEIE